MHTTSSVITSYLFHDLLLNTEKPHINLEPAFILNVQVYIVDRNNLRQAITLSIWNFTVVFISTYIA